MSNTTEDLSDVQKDDPTQSLSLGAIVQIAGRIAAEDLERVAAEYGLAAGQLSLLGMVRRVPGLTQTTYADILCINDATLARYVEKLVQRRLLIRNRGEKDRRVVFVELSPEGCDVVQGATRKLQQMNSAYEEALGADRVAELTDGLRKFVAAIGMKRKGA